MVPLAQLFVDPAPCASKMVLLTHRSDSAVRNLTLFPPDTHHQTCATRHSSARGLPTATSLRQFLPAVGYPLLPAVGPLFSPWVLGSLPWLFLASNRSALFRMGPWVPFLADFPLSCLHCPARGTGAAMPRAPLTSVMPCFQGLPGHLIYPSRRSEPWLHFDHPAPI